MKTLTAEAQRHREEWECFIGEAWLLRGVLALCLCASVVIPGCIEHRIKADPIEVKPIKVEPIHITVDVNVRVDRQLDQFFAFQEDAQKKPPENK